MRKIKHNQTLRHLRSIAKSYGLVLREVSTENEQAHYALFHRFRDKMLSDANNLNWWRMSQRDELIQKIGRSHKIRLKIDKWKLK